MTHDGAALGAHSHFTHAPVTLKTLAVIGDFEPRHLGACGVIGPMAIFAGHETACCRALEGRCLDGMAFVTGQACIIAVLVMTHAAITGNGDVFFMVEEYGPIDVHETVQFDEPMRGGRTHRRRRL